MCLRENACCSQFLFVNEMNQSEHTRISNLCGFTIHPVAMPNDH